MLARVEGIVSSAPLLAIRQSIILTLLFIPSLSGTFGLPRILTAGVGLRDVACLFLLPTNVKPSVSIRYIGSREGSP